jgi:hypothetical protein
VQKWLFENGLKELEAVKEVSHKTSGEEQLKSLAVIGL